MKYFTMKKELADRWKSKEGELQLNEAINCLTKNKDLSSLTWLKKYNGRWDLRGAKLSSLVKEQKIEANGHSFTQKKGSLKLKNCKLVSIDFSYSDISYADFEKITIEDCLFKETRAKEIKVVASSILNTVFEKTDFSYSFMGENVGSDSGKFINVQFIETNLKECIFCFPLIHECVFENCNFKATNFNGSRMKNCNFIGKIDSAWFKGYAVNLQKSILVFFNRVDPLQYPNTMENIDFSKAILIGVSFSDSIVLSKCIFPNDPNILIVSDFPKKIIIARNQISEEWTGEFKHIGIHMIDNVYYKKEYHNQDISIIDKYLLVEQFGEQFAICFFNLFYN